MLEGLNFKRLPSDLCIYRLVDGPNWIILVVYVDDFYSLGNSQTLRLRILQQINERFELLDLGELNFFVGMKITRDRENGTIKIDQEPCVLSLLDRFGMTECNIFDVPGNPSVKLTRKSNEDEKDERELTINGFNLRAVVGALLYLAINTRPDIAFQVILLSRFLENPRAQHITAAKHILHYLRGTAAVGITYKASGNGNSKLRNLDDTFHSLILSGFADSDWAGDEETRRSTTGWIFFLAGGPICWSSILQKAHALSSAEAEYYALGSAVQEAIWLRCFLGQLGFPQKEPTNIQEDNQGAIMLSKNDVFHNRTRHIESTEAPLHLGPDQEGGGVHLLCTHCRKRGRYLDEDAWQKHFLAIQGHGFDGLQYTCLK